MACEWSLAKVYRIENGTSIVKKSDLEALLRHYGVDDDHIQELTARAREARAPGWWEDYDFGPDRGFEAYVGYEDGASSIRMWHPLVVPGLIQTPAIYPADHGGLERTAGGYRPRSATA